ncbi:alanine racemase [bacterium]|nr:alanine racemase [bacterium]
MHYTWLELDREQVHRNIVRLREQAGDRALLAVVKANGYGLGAVSYTKMLKAFGINWFGVASIKEGMALRDAGIHATILIQSEPFDSPPEDVVNYNLIPTVYTLEYAAKLNELAGSRNIRIPIHVKVDTGMARLGVGWADYPAFLTQLKSLIHLEIAGLFTHYANSETAGDPFIETQFRRFSDAIALTNAENIFPKWIHAANSGGIVNAPLDQQTLVRAGLALTENAVQLKSRVLAVKRIGKGDPVSYSGRFVADVETWIGVVGTGYSDGMPTTIENPQVLIDGKRYPVVGTICMDMMLVNLGPDMPSVRRGEEVVLIGHNKDQVISMTEFCEKTGKNPREVTCNFGARCRTIYT